MQTTNPGVRHARLAFLTGVLVAVFATATLAQCVGDCSSDNEVTVNEIIVGVNIVLGTSSLDSCPSFDVDQSGDVTINEIIAAVNNALFGCPQLGPTDTPLPTIIPTSTSTAVSTSTGEPTGTPTESPQLTPTVRSTSTPTVVPSSGPSTTPTPSPTPMPSLSPTPPVATATNTPSPTPTSTPGAPTGTATATATASATATPGAAVCGNGTLDDGESCDDGNTITNPPGDTCPADCTIINCPTDGTTRTVSVSFTPPAGKSVSSISVLLEYPDGTVKVQGTGSDPSVQTALSNTPGGTLVAAVDYDYALSVQLAGTRAITPGKLFDLSVRNCRGASPPAASAFKCTVTDATAPDSSAVTGVTCAASLP